MSQQSVEMTSTERWAIGGLMAAIFVVSVAVGSWMLTTLTIHSARISVLEQRSNNHDRVMDELKGDLRQHRAYTEHLKESP